MICCHVLPLMKRFRASAPLLVAAVGMIAGNAPAQPPVPAPPTIPLWSGPAPGAQGTADIDIPKLLIFAGKNQVTTGTGVVICPGGGYAHLSMEKEGTDIAKWLNARGVAGFVLQYRLGPKYHHPVELHDAQRALRYVRSHAADYGIAPNRIGIWGFSAGGHLASSTGTHFDSGDPNAADPIDRAGSRPDFMILSYPVITLVGPKTHQGSKKNLLGDNPDPDLARSLSSELQVTAQTPPTFLFTTNGDTTVPAENSIEFYLAMRKAGVPGELHVYQNGPHGVGLALNDPILSSWPQRLEAWLHLRGLL
jgi:acetyl esterase/lipase